MACPLHGSNALGIGMNHTNALILLTDLFLTIRANSRMMVENKKMGLQLKLCVVNVLAQSDDAGQLCVVQK